MQIKVTRIRKSSLQRAVEKQILGRGVVGFVLTGQNASFFYLFKCLYSAKKKPNFICWQFVAFIL